jgi:hypothetical protein
MMVQCPTKSDPGNPAEISAHTAVWSGPNKRQKRQRRARAAGSGGWARAALLVRRARSTGSGDHSLITLSSSLGTTFFRNETGDGRPTRNGMSLRLLAFCLLAPVGALSAPRGAWPVVQEALIKAPFPDRGDFYGVFVVAHRDRFAVSFYFDDSCAANVTSSASSSNACSNSGAVHVYQRSGSVAGASFVLEAVFGPPWPYAKFGNAGFGENIALCDSWLVVSAPRLENNRGAFYVYLRHGSNWSFLSMVRPALNDPGDRFGSHVACEAGRVVALALFEGSCATAVNGNELDNSCPQSGAAYVFRWDETTSTFVQEAYIKPHNTASGMAFGEGSGGAVSISGPRIIVGSRRDDSCDTIPVNAAGTDHTAAHGVVQRLYSSATSRTSGRKLRT